MSGALLIQANALSIPLRDESVDLIVTSPPYFSLRSYRDGGEHYAGQLGSEPTPQAFLEALWAVLAECWRVLKPSGSCFVNLGDKRSGSGGHNNNGLTRSLPGVANGYAEGTAHKRAGEQVVAATRRNAPDRYNQAAFGRPKSKMLLPHRFAIGCEDGMADPDGKGWVMRSDIVWQKLNGLPESVTDRCRDSHEYLFHMTKAERYFAAVDEVREPSSPQAGLAGSFSRPKPSHDLVPGQTTTQHRTDRSADGYNPLGKLPGSVWTLSSEPLVISDEVAGAFDLPSHFAAYPQELPRRAILGWSPAEVCVACGEGRRPVTVSVKGPAEVDGAGGWRGTTERRVAGEACGCNEPIATPTGTNGHGADPTASLGKGGLKRPRGEDEGTCLTSRWEQRHYAGQIKASPHRAEMQADLGGSFDHYTKPSRSSGRPLPAAVLDRWLARGWLTPAPPFDPPPTRPAVVLDPFCGTGTTVGVARALGRIGIGLDLSADYLRLARWRVERSGNFSKTVARTNREHQGSLL